MTAMGGRKSILKRFLLEKLRREYNFNIQSELAVRHIASFQPRKLAKFQQLKNQTDYVNNQLLGPVRVSGEGAFNTNLKYVWLCQKSKRQTGWPKVIQC